MFRPIFFDLLFASTCATLGAAALDLGDATPTLKEVYLTGYPPQILYGTGEFTSGTTAVTSSDSLPDYFSLRGGQLVRMSEAGVFDSYEIIDGGVDTADVTALRLGGIDPGTDGVVHVGSAGLRWTQVNSSTNTAETTTIAAADTTGIQVRVGNVVGDVNLDLVVLDADRTTFRVYEGNAFGFSGTPDSFTVAGQTVADFDLGRIYASSPLSALLVAVQNGFQAYRVTTGFPPTLLMNRINAAYTQNQVERLRDHGGLGLDGFAFLTRLSTIDQWVLIAGVGSGFQSPTHLPDGLEVVGMSAGRIDDNNLEIPGTVADPDDLVLSFEDAGRIRSYLNLGYDPQAPAFETGTSNEVLIETGWSGVNQASFPTVRDLDGNRRGDVMIGFSEGNEQDLLIAYDVDELEFDAISGGTGSAFDWVEDNQDHPWKFDVNVTSIPAETVLTGVVQAPFFPMSGEVVTFLYRQESANEDFVAQPVAACGGSDPQSIQLPSSSDPNQWEIGMTYSDTVWGQAGRFFALRLRPKDAYNDGRQPTIMMGFETHSEFESPLFDQLAAYPGLNAGIQVRQGAASSFVNFVSGGTLGTGIVVAKIPVRRIKPPTPPVEPMGGTDCPVN